MSHEHVKGGMAYLHMKFGSDLAESNVCFTAFFKLTRFNSIKGRVVCSLNYNSNAGDIQKLAFMSKWSTSCGF